MANIKEVTKQDGSKVWRVMWREPGGRQLSIGFDSKSEALRYAHEVHFKQ